MPLNLQLKRSSCLDLVNMSSMHKPANLTKSVHLANCYSRLAHLQASSLYLIVYHQTTFNSIHPNYTKPTGDIWPRDINVRLFLNTKKKVTEKNKIT